MGAEGPPGNCTCADGSAGSLGAMMVCYKGGVDCSKPAPETVLSKDAKKGDTSIDVQSTEALKQGTPAILDRQGAHPEVILVTGIGSAMLQNPLRFDHKAGAFVSTGQQEVTYGGGDRKMDYKIKVDKNGETKVKVDMTHPEKAILAVPLIAQKGSGEGDDKDK